MATRIETYKPEDIKLIKTRPMFTNFGTIGEDDYVELHVLSGDNVLESDYNVNGWSILKEDTKNSSPTIKLDIHNDIRDLGYRSGRFNLQYNFFRKIVGDNTNSLIIEEISKTRQEIRIRPKDPFNIPLCEELISFGNREHDVNRVDIEVDFFRDIRLNFGEGFTPLAINWMIDYQVFPEYPYSLVIKLYEPLPKEIQERDELWIVKAIVESILEPILIEYDAPSAIPNTLAPADFTTPQKFDSPSPTGYKTWDDILGSSDSTNTVRNKLLSKYLNNSSSLGDVRLNFDFNIQGYDFSKLVHFGSAVEKLENFKYKLTKIESYSASIAGLTSDLIGLSGTGATGSFEYTTNVTKYTKLQASLIGTFDEFENHLYYESASGISTTYGDIWPITWPKTSQVEPYELAKVKSLEVKDWYGSLDKGETAYFGRGAIYSASLYDASNDDRLLRLIPSHIQEDPDNSQYLLFTEMMSQHFDYIYFYIEALLDIHKRDNPLYEGVSKDLIQPILESFGWYPHQGFDFDDLWSYAMGTDTAGSYGGNQINYTADFTQSVTYANNSQASQSFSKEEITKELWKRILNNLPGLLKTKGSERSIRALISTYGLPPSILRIYEHGGPEKLPNRHSKIIYDRFNYALKIDSGSSAADAHIEGPWGIASAKDGPNRYPDTVEFRFKIPDRTDDGGHCGGVVLDNMLKHNTVLWNLHSGSVSIVAEHTTSQYPAAPAHSKIGRVGFYLSGSQNIYNAVTDWGPIFDGNWWTLVLSRFDATKVAADEDYAWPETSTMSSHANNPNGITYQMFCKKQGDFSQFGKISHALSASLKLVGTSADKYAANSAWGTDVESLVSQSTGLSINALSNFSSSGTDGYSYTTPASSSPDTSGWRSVDFTYPIHHANSASTQKQYLGGKTDGDWITKFTDSTAMSSNVMGHMPKSFSGSMQEWRVYHHHISESVVDIHTGAPRSIINRKVTASYTDLLGRWSLGCDMNKYDFTNGSHISSSAPNYSLNPWTLGLDTTAKFRNFNSIGLNQYEAVEERHFTLSPRNIGQSPYSEKIRIEDNALQGNLSIDNKVEFSSFDKNPLDTNKLGVFFSPQDEIELDIAHEFGPFAYDDYVGSPTDEYKNTYKPLKVLRENYFRKYDGNPSYFDYLYMLQYFDDSLFRTIRQLLPARTNAQVGLMVKPHGLERPKIQTKPSMSKVSMYIKDLPHQDPLDQTILDAKFSLFQHMSVSSNLTEVGGFFSESYYRARPAHRKPDFDTFTKDPLFTTGRLDSFELTPASKNSQINKDLDSSNDVERAKSLDNRTVGELEVDMDYKKFGYDHWLNGSRYIHTTVEFPRDLSGDEGTGSNATSSGILADGSNGAMVWNAYYNRDAWGMTIHNPPHHYTHNVTIDGREYRNNAGGANYDLYTASLDINITDGWKKWGLNRAFTNEIYVPFIGDVRKSFERKKQLFYYATEWSQSAGLPIPEADILSNRVDDYFNSRLQGQPLPSHSLTNPAEFQDFKQTGLSNLWWNGCKLVGSDFNMESAQTIDGGPVVEYHEISPYKYVAADENSDGKLLTAGEGIGGQALRDDVRTAPVGRQIARPNPQRGGFSRPAARNNRRSS
tara:strand:+ start:10096 stop:14889 length:4794 start_codon:yes stop_codon:yes gene_type:complete